MLEIVCRGGLRPALGSWHTVMGLTPSARRSFVILITEMSRQTGGAAIPLTDFSSRKLSQLVSAGYGFERSGLTLPLGANFKSSS
jgi:hypothetical protein